MLRRVLGKRWSRSVLVSGACLAFLGGAVLANWVGIRHFYEIMYVFPLAILGRRHYILGVGGLLITMMVIGCWRGTQYMDRLALYQKLQAQKTMVIEGQANGDAVYGTQSQLTFDLHNARVVSGLGTGEHLVGNIQISGFGVTMVYNGDIVRVQGKMFLARGNDVARMSFAQLSLIGHHLSPIDTMRRRFTAGLQSAVPEPLASFGMGLLVGQRNTLPTDVSTQLQMVGLTHIIAVSGYNLTIIMRAVKSLFGKRSKYQYTLLSILLMLGFLLLAGASPSIIRASVVCGISLMTWYFGREMPPVSLILLAAAITVWADPLYAWNNVSWMLSFLAFFGVVVISPIATKRLFKEREPKLVAAIILESLCAEAMTLPYILLIFGQMSFVSLLANVLVAAWIPLAMILSLVAGLVGMFVPMLAGWFAWPAILLMTYMLDITALLSRIPHAFVQNIGFSGWLLAGSYALVAVICTMAWHKTRQNAIITDRNESQGEDA